MEAYLCKLLYSSLDSHLNVGDIRDRGLFYGIEFVQDKVTAKAFALQKNVAFGILDLGLCYEYNITLYLGTKTVDGIVGDHILLAPPYNVTRAEAEGIVERTKGVGVDYVRVKDTGK
ncbi:MAG: hypothetical protein M1834_003532 [Cirrosporium novae-zelandiae]|nr:MAG: hypothetical protein M1834_003532 [Cirrosporium novae-zelandiae]